MKALVIDPQTKIVEEVYYEPDPRGSSFTIEKVLGARYSYEHEFSNGDVLYASRNAKNNAENKAFWISSVHKPIFGKAIIIGFSKQTIWDFVNCRFSTNDLLKKVKFCSTDESAILRVAPVMCAMTLIKLGVIHFMWNMGA